MQLLFLETSDREHPCYIKCWTNDSGTVSKHYVWKNKPFVFLFELFLLHYFNEMHKEKNENLFEKLKKLIFVAIEAQKPDIAHDKSD